MGGALTLSVPFPLRSQEQGETQPKPAARSLPPLSDENQQVTDENGTDLRPDDRPLTGFQNPTTGSPVLRHSYWQPGITYDNAIQSNGLAQGGGRSWSSTNYLQGNLSLLEAWHRGQLGINYTGGGYFSTDSSIGSGQDHQLGVVQEFDWERYQLTFVDQFSYLPGNAFGFGAGTNLSFPGVAGSPGSITPGLGNGFIPSQSIYTGFGPEYSNSFGSQVNYQLSRRSSITVGGVYGILRFTNPGNIESDDVVLNAGYNYAITRKDSFGVVYRFSAYHFLGQPQAIGDHSPQLSYGRKITGRLALQLSGGAEITTFRSPIAGETQHVGGSASASISYGYKHGGVSLNYNHGVSGGSGVLLGASTDQFQLQGSRQLTRQWHGNVQFGYARNRNVVTAAAGTNAASYDTFYGGGGVDRALGRNLNFFGAYTAYIQHSSATAACIIGTCGTDYTSHQITLGFSWHTRPFVLR
jgi:hypothetical protein